MLQASLLDGLALDPFAFCEDGLSAAEVDIGGCEIVEALVRSGMVVMLDEGRDLPLKVGRRRLVLELGRRLMTM